MAGKMNSQITDKIHTLILYDCKKERFSYPNEIHQMFPAAFDERPLWQIAGEDGLCSRADANRLRRKIIEMAQDSEPQAYFTEYYLYNTANEGKWYRVGLINAIPKEIVSITLTDVDHEVAANQRLSRLVKCDELTGLLNRKTFAKEVEKAKGSKCALVYFDVIRFKAINDIFGMAEGDRLLRYIADTIRLFTKENDVLCRLGSDRFAFFTDVTGKELEDMIENMLNRIADFDLPIGITCNVGIYLTNEENLTTEAMIDRAVLAQSVVKGSYTIKCNYYTEALRKDMLGEQEIVGMMATALVGRHFVVYYQPQYDHSTGMLVGAEALVRWNHPERGLISPGIFIPIFEKNGFITKLDYYVFEQVCYFIRSCMDKGLPIVPVSSNFSRHDIFQQDFVEQLEAIRVKYDVPAKFLRVEITESCVVGNSAMANEVVNKLHKYGYIVEMDDFGSGYSSLNVLKDIELDVIKLDMLFLSQETNSKRGGTILSSIVRMAKWLGMPVIAEGVETAEQADFLRSIGCNYIQGYLYSRPLPENQYEDLISGSAVGTTIPQMKLIETLNAGDFWDPKSLETLIFSNYVGGAAIFGYHKGEVEILRVNKKYLQEICMNLSEKELIQSDPLTFFDEANRKIYSETLRKAIETEDEQECETWRTLTSDCCGEEKMCLRSNVRMIGKSGDRYLFYAMIRNITSEKERYKEILDSERRFQMASEQVNIYYWEYTIATKEMRPCFRCMRDLGLPPLLTNYPDSAIEMGIFPPEVADMYRDWHRQVAEGVPQLEAVIPLTVGRVPFRVRYTTEFDENGRPVKAYGSAALIVD